jgi:hypothetical protein
MDPQVYQEDTDIIKLRVRNPYTKKWYTKQYKLSRYGNDRQKAIEAANKWKEEIVKLIDEENKIKGRNEILHQGPNTVQRLKNQIALQQQDPLSTSSTPLPLSTPSIPDIKLKPFSPNWIKEKTGSTLSIIGKSKSGKTTLLRKILKNVPKDVITVFISPNLQNEIYEGITKKFVHSYVFDSRIIKLIQKIQQKTKNHYRFLIVFDDVIDQKNSAVIIKLFLILRNSLINTIISLQSPLLLNKLIRGNCNYTICGKLSGEESIIDLYKKFLSNYREELGIDKNLKNLVDVYKNLTDNFNFLSIDHLKDKIHLTNKNLDY